MVENQSLLYQVLLVVAEVTAGAVGHRARNRCGELFLPLLQDLAREHRGPNAVQSRENGDRATLPDGGGLSNLGKYGDLGAQDMGPANPT